MSSIVYIADGSITPQQLKQHVAELFEYAKANGLSELEQDAVVDVILNTDLSTSGYFPLSLFILTTCF